MDRPALDKINALNILGMALAAGLAVFYPFQLFLFAYAVLGPLHYLTEISWLKDRNYYTRGRADYIFLGAMSLLVTFFYLGWIPAGPKGTSELLIGLALFSAGVFAFAKSSLTRLAVIPLAAVAAFGLSGLGWFQSIFGVFLPTLVHVFLFTGLFILAGALKSRSLSGFVSLGAFFGAAAFAFFFHPSGAAAAGDAARKAYGSIGPDGVIQGFVLLNYEIARLLSLPLPASGADLIGQVNGFLYQNPGALGIMAFISFAYTYHYFNWFSKTSVIRWNEISKRRAGAILLVWGLSLGLYAYDYGVGMKWLFFLSLTHVILEFPLNHLTALQVGKELKGMVWGKA